MNIELDTHTHTVASIHAYSTITENAAEAARKNLKLICMTDHGPLLPGGTHEYFFSNMKVLPKEIHGVRILKGIETNIKNTDGDLDIPKHLENRMEIVLVGLHEGVLPPGTKKENTTAVVNAMKKEFVDILVHPGNPVYELDYDDVFKAARDTNTFIEINNSSFLGSRKGSKDNCRMIAEKCRDYKLPISLGSDAHYSTYVGEFSVVTKLLEEIQLPEELILNTSVDKLLNYLKNKGKNI